MSSPEPVTGQVAPYTQQPGQQQRPAPRSQTALVPGRDMNATVGAVITMLLGVLLGIANQGAGGTSMNLRVPALLASLLIFGQGVVNFLRAGTAKPKVEHIPSEEPAPVSRELPSSRPARVRQTVTVAPSPKPTPSTLAVPVVVVVLAAWLGWADLVTAAPDSLAVLSLVAAFALFAIGWSLLPTRH